MWTAPEENCGGCNNGVCLEIDDNIFECACPAGTIAPHCELEVAIEEFNNGSAAVVVLIVVIVIVLVIFVLWLVKEHYQKFNQKFNQKEEDRVADKNDHEPNNDDQLV